MPTQPRIIYARQHNISGLGLERLHPFDSCKYRKAYRLLKRRFKRSLRRCTITTDRPARPDELTHVHSPDYLRRLRNPRYVANALELPPLGRLPGPALDWFVLRPMRWATRGTCLAAGAALENGLAINLGGGFHHAKPTTGEGFCIYADVAIAVRWLQRQGTLPADARIAHIDLDAHQGNGVCHAFREDREVFLFDMFNGSVYPLFDRTARERIDCSLPLQPGTGDEEYLARLRKSLPGFLDSIGQSHPVRLAFYNAGTDPRAGDPLGGLDLSAAAILERDRLVIEHLREREIPTVMVTSGGYTSESYRLMADSVTQLLQQWGTFE
ncbi:MAG: histone deacetylase [Maioricimonas sp. JB049]